MVFDTANRRNELRSSIICRRVHPTLFPGHKVLIDLVCQAFDMTMMMIGFTTHLSTARHLVNVTPSAAHLGSGGT